MSAFRFSRRKLLRLTGASSAALWLAACASPAATPTAPPPPAAPTTAAQPSPKAAAPTAAPTAPAPAATQAPAKPATLTPVRFATINGLFHLISYEMAKKRNIFRDVGIDLSVTGTTGDVVILQGIRANEFDLSDGGPVTPIVAMAQGGDFRIIGATTTKLYYAMYATPSLDQISDLAGRNIGTAAIGSLPHLATEAWLRTQNIEPSNVTFVALGPTPEIFRAVVAGKVEAGVAGMDFMPEAQRQGLSVLSDRVPQDLPGYFMLGIYCRGDDLQDTAKRDVYTRFLVGLAQMNRMIYDRSNKDEWVRTAVELQARNEDDMSFFYDWMVDNKLMAANVEFSQEQIDFVQRQTVLSGSQPEVLPFDRVATLELQKAAISQLGEFTYPA